MKMKKLVPVLFFSLTMSSQLAAQDISWVTTFDSESAITKSVTVDQDGFIYSLTDFKGSITLNGTTIVSGGETDILFTKQHPDGSIIWYRQFTGANYDLGTDIQLDNNEDIVILGNYNGEISFEENNPNAVLTFQNNAVYAEAFITKFNKNGSFIWAKKFTTTENSYIHELAFDADNNYYFNGNFQEEIDLDPSQNDVTVTSQQGTTFILTLNEDGEYLRHILHKRANFTSIDIYNNTIYAAGTFSDSVSFDNGGTWLFGVQYLDLFIAKFDLDGTLQEANVFGGNGFEHASSIRVSPNGNIILTGDFENTCNFSIDGGTVELTSYGNTDAFIVSYNPNKSINWIKHLGGSNEDHGLAVNINNTDEILVAMIGKNSVTSDLFSTPVTTNTNSTDVFISKLSADGTVAWNYMVNSSGFDHSSQVFFDDFGSYYMTGQFGGEVNFNPSGTAIIKDILTGSEGSGYLIKGGISTLSVHENDNHTLTVYPNPSSGSFILESDNLFTNYSEYQILDLTGKIMSKGLIVSDRQTIPVTSLNNGLYIVQLLGEQNHVFKIEVKK